MAQKILVVDDDALVGDLTMFLLRDAGYDAELVQDSLMAISAIKAKRPDLVILDILMPGVDGLTLCRQLKSDPELKSIKVVIVSGKSFAEDKERALRYGADAFIDKPYHVDSFAKKISAILAKDSSAQIKADPPQPPAAQPLPETPAAQAENLEIVFKVKIWGSRGHAPAGNLPSSRYGRKTPCVSAEFDDRLFIFDAGSGLSSLGDEILKAGRHKNLWLFLTHFHPDHISGLGTFPGARLEGGTLSISGANDPEKSLQAMVEETFQKSSALGPVTADIQLYELLEETYEILPEVKLTAFYANHPTTTLGFKLTVRGRTLVYCPDSEIYGDAATALQDFDEKTGKLLAGADMLIHDGRYTDADYENHKNEGHSSFVNAIEFAARNKIKRVVLIHQDGSYEDDVLDQMSKDAERLISEKGYALQCALAREGLEISV